MSYFHKLAFTLVPHCYAGKIPPHSSNQPTTGRGGELTFSA